MNEQEINVTSLLLQISSDVAVIKNDMANFKESCKADNEDLRKDFNREITALSENVNKRINSLQTVQNTLVGDVDILKHKDDTKDANTYRKITAYCLTALGGMLAAKIPDFLAFIIRTLNK